MTQVPVFVNATTIGLLLIGNQHLIIQTLVSLLPQLKVVTVYHLIAALPLQQRMFETLIDFLHIQILLLRHLLLHQIISLLHLNLVVNGAAHSLTRLGSCVAGVEGLGLINVQISIFGWHLPLAWRVL